MKGCTIFHSLPLFLYSERNLAHVKILLVENKYTNPHPPHITPSSDFQLFLSSCLFSFCVYSAIINQTLKWLSLKRFLTLDRHTQNSILIIQLHYIYLIIKENTICIFFTKSYVVIWFDLWDTLVLLMS